jgi:hypothetical protein
VFLCNKLEWKDFGTIVATKDEYVAQQAFSVERIVISHPISAILLGVEEYKWLQVSPLILPPPPSAVRTLLFNTKATFCES